jgi:hypothetical protein
MKYFRSEYSIYHEGMHENMGVWCQVRALGWHTERTGRLLTELVSINGIHFVPERIGDGLCDFRFKPCPRSLLHEMIMGKMHSIFHAFLHWYMVILFQYLVNNQS